MFKTKSVPAFQKQAGTVSDLWLKNTKIESGTFVIAMARQIPGWNINTDLRPKHGTFAFAWPSLSLVFLPDTICAAGHK